MNLLESLLDSLLNYQNFYQNILIQNFILLIFFLLNFVPMETFFIKFVDFVYKDENYGL